AEREYGFQIYQGGVVPGKSLHIVSISEWDIEACGGTHLDNTGDIGFIKLVSSERIQDGVVRIEILAGDNALKYIQNQETILHESASILSVEPKILPKTARRFFKEWKEQKKTIESLNKKIAELQYSPSKIEPIKIKDTYAILMEASGNQKELILQASEAVKNYKKGVCILVATFENKLIIVGTKSPSLDINISEIVREVSEIAGGSGGGKGNLAIGGGPLIDTIPSILERAKELLKTEIEG
ncbi:MAG: DHHA1 domain-containing protein, partial [Candidatus Thorarchaeota archaeon]